MKTWNIHSIYFNQIKEKFHLQKKKWVDLESPILGDPNSER